MTSKDYNAMAMAQITADALKTVFPNAEISDVQKGVTGWSPSSRSAVFSLDTGNGQRFTFVIST